ncbi:MAG: hypothetical protein HY532_09625 [Chloroflexi bacterium]|nr:hypothetical protein [Chloroflexota bacterium]
MKRLWTAVFLTLVVGLLPLPALAGQPTVVTLDALPPGQVSLNEPITIGFTVLAANTPVEGVVPRVRAEMYTEHGYHSLTFLATASGAPGHYVAVVEFPLAGDWEWWVSGSWFPAKNTLPPLSFVDPSATDPVTQAPSPAPAAPAPFPWLWLAYASAAAFALAFLLALAVLVGRLPSRILAPQRAR